VRVEARRRTERRLAGTQGLLLGSEGEFGISVGCLEVDVTEPATDDVNLYSGFQEMHSRSVTEKMRGDASRVWAGDIQMLGVPSDDLVDPKAS